MANRILSYSPNDNRNYTIAYKLFLSHSEQQTLIFVFLIFYFLIIVTHNTAFPVKSHNLTGQLHIQFWSTVFNVDCNYSVIIVIIWGTKYPRPHPPQRKADSYVAAFFQGDILLKRLILKGYFVKNCKSKEDFVTKCISWDIL